MPCLYICYLKKEIKNIPFWMTVYMAFIVLPCLLGPSTFFLLLYPFFNHQVDGNRFDGDFFYLGFPTINIIDDAILTMEGKVTLAKIDVGCPFRNLCADPGTCV